MNSEIPKHVAIIMDGNGRWAKLNNKTRLKGHKSGVKSVREIIQKSQELGLENLTLYAFSKDNWLRPDIEVKGLMQLLYITLKKELANFNKNNIKVSFIGDISSFPSNIKKLVNQTIKETSENNSLHLNIALGYSSRQEIVDATKSIVQDVLNDDLDPIEINSEIFSKKLQTSESGYPDLLIRTGGESRVSDFLLWQIAYTEIYFTEIFWPDFNKYEFMNAISNYQKRERRFGKISEQIS